MCRWGGRWVWVWCGVGGGGAYAAHSHFRRLCPCCPQKTFNAWKKAVVAFMGTEHDDSADDRIDGNKALPLESIMQAIGKKDALWSQPYERFEVQGSGDDAVVRVAEWKNRKKGSVHGAMPNSKDKEVQGPDGQWHQPSNLVQCCQAHLTFSAGTQSARRGDDLRRMDWGECFRCYAPENLFPQGDTFTCLAFPVWLNKTNDGHKAEDYIFLTNTEDPLEDPLMALAINLMLEAECLGTGKIGTLGASGYQTPAIRGAPDKEHGGYQRSTYDQQHASFLSNLQYAGAVNGKGLQRVVLHLTRKWFSEVSGGKGVTEDEAARLGWDLGTAYQQAYARMM